MSNSDIWLDMVGVLLARAGGTTLVTPAELNTLAGVERRHVVAHAMPNGNIVLKLATRDELMAVREHDANMSGSA